MLCKGNLAHGHGVGWCLGTAGDDGLCPAHQMYPLYRPGSRGSAKATARAQRSSTQPGGEEEKPRRRKRGAKVEGA